MTFTATSSDRLLSMMLTLGQFPILSNRIRIRMRRELFNRGLLNQAGFEAEIREKAMLSQRREGLMNPVYEEPNDIWETRLTKVRDQLTDLYFSQHLSYSFFEQIVNDVLKERGVDRDEQLFSITPELAPIELVFEQAMAIDKMPVEDRGHLEARLQEAKVVLIRTMISDQLRYINIAKEWLNLEDLIEIRRRKIGGGRIGGKAAGMLLAARVVKELASAELRAALRTPESYYIGSDLIYTFMAINNLFHWNDQKYKTETEMREEYPLLVKEFLAGDFPPDILDKLVSLLVSVGNVPLIVRSSSLLEDNFGTSFAGKYESIFLPNQGSLEENLRALSQAIARVYASTLNPNALLYRRAKGLQDYDERMAILIQTVVGENLGDYYLPHGAGVAFSRNLYRWSNQIKADDGFIRLVWGLGTRAVDRVGNDYPRLVALSHPLLRPSTSAKNIRRYSQQFVDVIDMKTNLMRTLPIQEVLQTNYFPLRYLVQLDEEGYFVSLRSRLVEGDQQRLVLTFEDLLRRTHFARHMRDMLHLLEESYQAPVDLEFALQLTPGENGSADLSIFLLQCRPQSHMTRGEQVPLPEKLSEKELIFSTQFVVPQGFIDGIKYVLYVPPEGYFQLNPPSDRVKLARAVGKLNAALKGQTFICVGPGRWGSSNSDLGVPIDYGDIYNSRSLVELAGPGIGPAPEPSLGTHFFQDLLESQIYPLAIYLEEDSSVFNRSFFESTPNHVTELVDVEKEILPALRLIRVDDYAPGQTMRIVMDDSEGKAVAFIDTRKKDSIVLPSNLIG
ncbi:MAG: hypothetical protein GYA15_03175 [Leptolinea sp.]|jgi:hypothetical protein|nr:hypothetical protein [Leptolinea sp.]